MAAVIPAFAQDASDTLAQGFQTPPGSAKPRVWWHWMNGNVTREGITADLEWMKRVGIGGLQMFDVGFHTPRVVEEPLVYMSRQWQEALRHAVSLADQLGLEMAIASSPGWSHTGGPWVEPRQAIKKLVWSETRLRGGVPFDGVLREPPSITGPFQGVPVDDRFDPGAGAAPDEFYADSVVLAYRRPRAEHAPTRASSSAGPVDVSALVDGELTKGMTLSEGRDGSHPWIRVEYAQPRAVQAITVGACGEHGAPPWSKRLEASDDGVSFRLVAEIPPASFVQQTVSFAPVTARYFRLILTAGVATDPWWSYRVRNAAPGAVTAFPPWAPDTASSTHTCTVTELVLHSAARVHRFEEKAGFALVPDYYAIASRPVPEASAVKKADVVDLTHAMDADGTLTWTPPPGDWVVLRMGYSLTGKRNQPASTEATGFEVDKLNRGHVKAYIDRYLDLFADAAGADRIGRRGIRALLQDSIETGPMNWTDDMIGEFRRLRGYDPTPWLPTLTGVLIESAEHSDKFLWDFRRTIAELLAENHYGQIAASAHERGMTVYAEALEDRRVHSLGDDMEMRKSTDVPMGAMWTFRQQDHPWPSYVADVRGAASVGHVYGRNIVAAESLTTILNPWAFAPRDLKPIIDLEFALGINRPVIHTSVHQPFLDRKPGLSLWIVGQYFNRHETWAEQAKPWVDYLSRSAFLLQHGRFVADVAYFYGEEAPLTGLFADGPIAHGPEGHGFDFVNADVVRSRFQVEDGMLVTPSGMRYRLLYLGGSSYWMTLPVLRRINELVEAGATIVGDRPVGSPSLADDPTAFRRMADRLWRDADGIMGKGRVIPGRDVNRALRVLGVLPDFDYRKPRPDSEVMFLHRTLDDGEIYFLSNRIARAERIEGSFRVTGYRPEIWRATTGTRHAVSYRIEQGRTNVLLEMEANDAFFVVFREPTTRSAETVTKPTATVLASIGGPWTLTFQPGREAPAEARLNRLMSLTEHEDPGIRHYSGTTSYRNSFDLPQDAPRDGPLWLDLGEVGDLAEIVVNRQPVGITWLAPHRIDITDTVKAGRNELEIRVTNLWANRLIGDAQPGVKAITFTTVRTYEPDAPLRPSGLMGPVALIRSSPPTK